MYVDGAFLNILFPFVGDSVGGSHHSVVELHRELKKNKISSIIVVHQMGPLSLFLDDINIAYEYLPIQRFAGEKPDIFSILYGSIINFKKIHKFMYKNKISIVHGNDLRINLTWSFPVKLSNVSYIWHQRSLMSASFFWRSVYFLADYFVSISNYVHQTLPDNIPDNRKKTILNPFNKLTYNKIDSRNAICCLYNVPRGVFLIGYVGRLVEWKNVDFLIECFSRYTVTGKSIHLLIVGTGKKEYVSKLKSMSKKYKNHITFSGFSNSPNSIISGLDLLIAPSDTEPFGRTLVEAMMQKTPVMAAKFGGHMEIVKHKDTGWLYEHANTKDFIDQLNGIVNKYKTIDGVVHRAYVQANLKYASNKHAKNMIDIYNQFTS